MRRRRIRTLAAGLLTGPMLTLALTGCGASTNGPALPLKPRTVDLEMVDYRFVMPAQLPPGRVVFRIRNTGHAVHRLLVVPLPPGFPPMSEEIKHPSGQVVNPLAGIPNRRPGARAPLAVDLTTGRYGFFCLVVDPDNRSHISKGMAMELDVR